MKNLILTDELVSRSQKTPITVEEKSLLMQAIQRKFNLTTAAMSKYWPRIKTAVNSRSRYLAYIARQAEKIIRNRAEYPLAQSSQARVNVHGSLFINCTREGQQLNAEYDDGNVLRNE